MSVVLKALMNLVVLLGGRAVVVRGIKSLMKTSRLAARRPALPRRIEWRRSASEPSSFMGLIPERRHTTFSGIHSGTGPCPAPRSGESCTWMRRPLRGGPIRRVRSTRWR
jgi:hypothetical protein